MLSTRSKRPLELRLPTAFQEALEAFELLSPENEKFKKRVDELLRVTREFQLRSGGDAVFGVLEDDIVCGTSRFPARERAMILLKEKLKAVNVRLLKFKDGVTREEIVSLLRALTAASSSDDGLRVESELREAGVTRIVCEDALSGKAAPRFQRENRRIWNLVRRLDESVYRELYRAMKTFRAALGAGEIPRVYPIRQSIETLVAAMVEEPDETLAIVFRPQKDDWVLAHTVRSAILALRLGIGLCADETTLHLLAESMLLNDVGLLVLPDSLINKRGDLTGAEQEEIKSHTIRGAGILLTGAGFAPSTIEAALLHHADPHGEGYPPISESTNPSVVCKIVRIVDAYECIVDGRPYREPQSPVAAAAELIGEAGLSLDGALVGRFIRTIGLAPVGSLVVLSNGEVAEVTKHNPEDLLRPTVNLLLDQGGTPYDDPEEMNLAQKDDVTIAKGVPLDPALEYGTEKVTA